MGRPGGYMGKAGSFLRVEGKGFLKAGSLVEAARRRMAAKRKGLPALGSTIPLNFPEIRKAMRVIHTADWHLGQRFSGQSREAEHDHFLDWLFETKSEEMTGAAQPTSSFW